MLAKKRDRRSLLKRKKMSARGRAEKIRHERRLHKSKRNLIVSNDREWHQFIPDRSRGTIAFPRTFSFLEDPDQVLSFFRNFRSELSKKFIKNFIFDHSSCETLGLDAVTLTDAYFTEELQRKGRRDLVVGGVYPKSLPLKIMFRAIGTIRMIQHPEMVLPQNIEQRIERSDLYCGNGRRLRKANDRDNAATSLATYFDRVLGHHGYALVDEGQVYFCNLITEVIGNAEEHSGRWYTRAFSQPSLDEDGGLEDCHIVIINFGKTIYESLNARNASTEVKKRIEALVAHHSKMRYFKPEWNEECLWTLCALQQGVSRYTNTQKGLTLRGRGTINMIKAFSELAIKPQKMCVLSGSAYVLFDGTYELYETESEGQIRQQISFNKEQTLQLPPDSTYVHSLKNYFPGTIISLRFTINREHLDEISRDN